MKYIITLSFIVLLAACNPDSKQNDDNNANDTTPPAPATGIPAPKPIGYTVLSEFPHDTSSFTEGLELHNGRLYESSGEYTRSSLWYCDPRLGVALEKHKLEDRLFGEGITILKDKIYQLTYQEHVGYVYDIKNIQQPIKTFNWPYEGWGMTNNGTDLIIDIGGPTNLYFVDPETFKVKNTLAVVDNKGQVEDVNELEWIDGFVWGNVWNTNRIIKIDPESGHVVGEMYMSNLAGADGRIVNGGFANSDVLNGIAYDSTKKTMLITGKRWPKMYEVRIN
ncbi:MAG: glutaminyl-peptide cyclotransferase [Ferruginibacter sp.]